MKVLMSAFSCGPGRGSEPGVGWNMAVEAARLGHEVVVLTQSEFATDIERHVASGRLPHGLSFDIYMPRWLERLRDIGLRLRQPALTWHLVSVIWQVCALRHVRKRYGDAGFDLVHHVTFAGIRHPTLLTRLTTPAVLGPLGGGDIIPLALRKSFPWKYWLIERARDMHNATLRWDPITRSAFHRARLIFVRTPAAATAVPPRDRHKVCIRMGLGAADMRPGEPTPRRPGEPLRLVYVGGLLYLKGIHLALRALAETRAGGADATLTIVGDGPARDDLDHLTRRLDLSPFVTFIGKVPRHELPGIYRDHHALVFPSLRDAGGMVVLEAWSQARPVLCFALGGPGQMVDESCGRVVSIEGYSESECATALAAQIAALSNDEPLRMSLSHGAAARYRNHSWEIVVADLYAEIERRLGGPELGGSQFGGEAAAAATPSAKPTA